MREITGEPVLAAEAVYRGNSGGLHAKWKCWEYYYKHEFWNKRI